MYFCMFFYWLHVSYWIICHYWGTCSSREQMLYLLIYCSVWIFLMYCSVWFVTISLRILHLYSSGILDFSSFFHLAFILFWYQGNAGFIKWIWQSSFLFYFLNSLKRIHVNSSFIKKKKILFIHLRERQRQSISGGRWKTGRENQAPRWLVVIDLFTFSISFWFSFGSSYDSWNISTYSKLLNLLTFFCNILLELVYFCDFSAIILLFLFLFIWVLIRVLLIFFIFRRNLPLDPLICSPIVLSCCVFYFWKETLLFPFSVCSGFFFF